MQWFPHSGIIYVVTLIVLGGMFSCKRTDPKKREECEFICLQGSDSTLSIRIVNHGKNKIYVPDEYDVCYTENSDTIYLEACDNPAYKKDYYYLYRNLFPYKIATTEKINGHEPDSTITISEQLYYNAFMVRAVVPILPDSVYFRQLVCSLPNHKNIVSAVFYRKGYEGEKGIRFLGSTYEEFNEFEKRQAGYLTTPLLQGMEDRK